MAAAAAVTTTAVTTPAEAVAAAAGKLIFGSFNILSILAPSRRRRQQHQLNAAVNMNNTLDKCVAERRSAQKLWAANRKQLPKKGPPTEDKPAKMQQKLQVPQRQSKRLSQEDCDDVIVCRALVTLSSKGRSARIPFRYPREVYTLLDVPYPDMNEVFD